MTNTKCSYGLPLLMLALTVTGCNEAFWFGDGEPDAPTAELMPPQAEKKTGIVYLDYILKGEESLTT